jgi:hypothetical protein
VSKYKHTQIGHVIIWALLAGTVLFAVSGVFESSPHPGATLIVSIVLLVTLVLFYKLTITVNDESLSACFGIGIIRKRALMAEIIACEPLRIRWWYGWGIHLTPYGWLYNVSGLEAVAITLRDGRKFALGTDDPQALVDAIERLISRM